MRTKHTRKTHVDLWGRLLIWDVTLDIGKMILKKKKQNLIRNLANRLTRPEIKTSPKDHLDSVLGGNLDLLLIKKQEYLYKEDATINYGLLIDKSG